jgi:hypothetical protein
MKGTSLAKMYGIPADELEKLVYTIKGDIYDCRDVMRAVRLWKTQHSSASKSDKKAISSSPQS